MCGLEDVRIRMCGGSVYVFGTWRNMAYVCPRIVKRESLRAVYVLCEYVCVCVLYMGYLDMRA